MSYRPLNNNEYIIVSKTIYEERGLTGGLAESMFMAYTARALALDEAEFIIFQESEIERTANIAEKQNKNVVELKAGSEVAPMDFLHKLESIADSNKVNKEPVNCYEWFYRDETLLNNRHKRLRMKFFNSIKYRKQVLRSYLDNKILQESQLEDVNLIGKLIGEFHRKYPGTRQGIISKYEIFFGDPSGFSYHTALEREQFHNDIEFRKAILKSRNLPENLSVAEIKEYLKLSALEARSVTQAQIEEWESTGFSSQ